LTVKVLFCGRSCRKLQKKFIGLDSEDITDIFWTTSVHSFW